MAKKWDRLIVGGNLATFADNGIPYGAIENGAIAISGRQIAWIGPVNELPNAPSECAEVVDRAHGRWILPGFIDCHTHLIFAGNRAQEFEQRLQGKSYAEIAQDGGGIAYTVQQTREATESDLVDLAAHRLRHLQAEGVTTIEIKSGYGLQVATERAMLKAARRLDDRYPMEIFTTFLGAHAMPPNYAGSKDDYIKLVIEDMLPTIAEENLADAVDAYCEHLAFDTEQVRRVFEAAAELDLPVKLHADQFSDCGGAALAAEFSALSADHLEYTSAAGIRALADAGTVAVLLPGAFHTLSETQLPMIDAMRKHQVPMAVATDCNPGSSPLSSILVAINFACVYFGLTVDEALSGATRNAAKALGVHDRLGTLEVGKQADVAIWDVSHPSELAYWIGGRRCETLYKAGEAVF